MVNAKVLKAINSSIIEEKKEMLKNLKVFLKDKIDGDFDQLSDFIDEFSEKDLDSKTKNSKTKKKGTRKKSYYNDWLGSALRELAKEQESLPESKRIAKTERMATLGEKWKIYKESDNFEKDKAQWKVDQENLEQEKSDKVSTDDDSDSKEEDVKKKAVKKKAAKKKAAKKKDSKDSSDDEIVTKKKDSKDSSDDSDDDDVLQLVTCNDSDDDSN